MTVIRLKEENICVNCGEMIYAGMNAERLSLPGQGGGFRHEKCRNVPTVEDAMKRIGLTEDVLLSIDRIVDYMHHEELKDYESRDEGEAREGHIYLDIKRLMEFKAGLS